MASLVCTISEGLQKKDDLRLLVESAPIGIMIVNGQGLIMLVNSLVEQMFGYSRDELLQQPVECLLPKAVQHRHSHLKTSYLSNPQTRPMGTGRDLFALRKDGSEFPVEIGLSAIETPEGRMVLSYITDITYRKTSEAELERLNQQLVTQTSELEACQTRLRDLAMELTLAEQRERRKIAMELHDFLAQQLVLCRFQLSHIFQSMKLNEKLKSSLGKVDTLLDESLSYTRSLVMQLTSNELHEFGLIQALQSLAETMSRQCLTVKFKAEREYVAMPENYAVLLYQSVRELLFNILKHAGVKKASVTVRVDFQMNLQIMVRDWGKGFSPAPEKLDKGSSGGLGLFSIYERMLAIGGNFAISSTVNHGTTVTLILPCQKWTRNRETKYIFRKEPVIP